MSKDKSIVFRSIPVDFKYHEKVYVIQYEFSGIQSFIFDDVTLDSTREEIASRSEYIQSATTEMEKWIRTKFSRWDKVRILSKSSGKLIYAVSQWTKVNKIINISEELQRVIYASTDGRLEMYYGFCLAKVIREDEINKYENCMSVLAVEANRNKFHCINILGAFNPDNKREAFTPKVNTRKNDFSKEKKNIMVAVKFDLDNLGNFFQKINSFDERKEASKCLAKVLEGAFADISEIEPLFIGGDDIFAICYINTYLQSVAHMYKNIVKGILSHDELLKYRESFGISGGISFIRNDLGKVPLVYYFEESEKKLMMAKSVSGKNVISVSNSIMTWKQLETISNVLIKKHALIFQGLNEQQSLNMYFNIKELKGRILRINANTKQKLLTIEEENDVRSIN